MLNIDIMLKYIDIPNPKRLECDAINKKLDFFIKKNQKLDKVVEDKKYKKEDWEAIYITLKKNMR